MNINYLNDRENADLKFLRELVSNAGGEWRGWQTDIEPDWAMVLFKNPSTEHMLQVPFHPTHFDGVALHTAVCTKLADDNDAFTNRSVSVKVSNLRTLARQLAEIQAELEALIERKKA